MTEDSDADSSWKKYTTKEERVFIMGAMADVPDSDTSLDSITAKRLLKKFRNKKKQLIKSNKAYWLEAGPGRLISDVYVEIIDSTGRGRMLKGLLDSGCTTSILFQQQVNKLTRGNKLKHATYGDWLWWWLWIQS